MEAVAYGTLAGPSEVGVEIVEVAVDIAVGELEKRHVVVAAVAVVLCSTELERIQIQYGEND